MYLQRIAQIAFHSLNSYVRGFCSFVGEFFFFFIPKIFSVPVLFPLSLPFALNLLLSIALSSVGYSLKWNMIFGPAMLCIALICLCWPLTLWFRCVVDVARWRYSSLHLKTRCSRAQVVLHTPRFSPREVELFLEKLNYFLMY